jgi:hypothetical protein
MTVGVVSYLLSLLLVIPTCINGATYNIRDYGARGDGHTLDTPSIIKAIQVSRARFSFINTL